MGSPRSNIARWWREIGWRHAVGVFAVAFAVFPVLYIVSAAFNPLGTVVSTSLVPSSFSLVNFESLFTDPTRPFARWFTNTLIVCVAVVGVQILFSALAAYAFSRFRFRGRRGGLLTLLLIQMFPQFLAAVALFALVTEMGEVVPAIGLDTILGYTLVLTGGALGQVWLIKGFFDTIPRELDEAAIMDGCGHAGVFFRIILPLVRPILAVTGLLAFVTVVGEFLLASIFLRGNDVKTLAVGLYGLIDADRSNNLGVFAAGALLRRPGGAAVPVPAALHRRRHHLGCGQGLRRNGHSHPPISERAADVAPRNLLGRRRATRVGCPEGGDREAGEVRAEAELLADCAGGEVCGQCGVVEDHVGVATTRVVSSADHADTSVTGNTISRMSDSSVPSERTGPVRRRVCDVQDPDAGVGERVQDQLRASRLR